MNTTTFIAVLMFTMLSGATSMLAQQKDSLSQYQTKTLSVLGKVKTPITLTVSDFAAMKSITVRNVNIVSHSGERKELIVSAKGVLLKDILDKAGIVFEERRDFNRLVIIAKASDGFRAVWTWHEIFNTDIGTAVLVIYEKNGQTLGSREGNFMMLSSKDYKTGPRHIRWLKEIEVLKL